MVTLALASNTRTRDPVQVGMVTNLGDMIAGTSGYGQLVRLNALSDATNYTNILGNVDTTNGRALQVQYGLTASPTILAQFNKASTVLNVPNYLKQTTGSDPGATYTALYAKNDSLLYYFPTGGAETRLAKSTEAAAPTLTGTGDLLTTSAPSTLSRLAIGTAFQELTTNSGATAPQWSSGVLARVTTAGDIVQATGANAVARLAIGTANQTLLVNAGATALAYGASMQSLLTAGGDIVYAASANTPARLAKGSDGQFLTLASGIPAWVTATPAGQSSVTSGSTSGPTTSSATPATLAEMTKTITTTGHNVLCVFSGTFAHSSLSGLCQLSFRIDAGTAVGTVVQAEMVANNDFVVTMAWLFTSVSAASHTFDVVWSTGGATLTALGALRQLIVQELPA